MILAIVKFFDLILPFVVSGPILCQMSPILFILPEAVANGSVFFMEMMP